MLREQQKNTLRCGNQIIEFTRPHVMGIVNATPDSFFTPSRTGKSVDKTLELALSMVSEGATMLDVGGISTRPGADDISLEEELSRVIPAIEAIHAALPGIIISVDTFRSEVARQACKAGATLINDISGGQADDQMYKVASACRAGYVLMHMRGTPKTMQYDTDYHDIISDLLKYFIKCIQELRMEGVEEIILDPGFGFAKTPEQNYQLVRQLRVFGLLELPVLIGVSRKSTLVKTIGRPAEETLHATTALHMAALQNGASILRVHDVRPAMDAIAVHTRLTSTQA